MSLINNYLDDKYNELEEKKDAHLSEFEQAQTQNFKDKLDKQIDPDSVLNN